MSIDPLETAARILASLPAHQKEPFVRMVIETQGTHAEYVLMPRSIMKKVGLLK